MFIFVNHHVSLELIKMTCKRKRPIVVINPKIKLLSLQLSSTIEKCIQQIITWIISYKGCEESIKKSLTVKIENRVKTHPVCAASVITTLDNTVWPIKIIPAVRYSRIMPFAKIGCAPPGTDIFVPRTSHMVDDGINIDPK